MKTSVPFCDGRCSSEIETRCGSYRSLSISVWLSVPCTQPPPSRSIALFFISTTIHHLQAFHHPWQHQVLAQKLSASSTSFKMSSHQ
jgi:hypothetical protein